MSDEQILSGRLSNERVSAWFQGFKEWKKFQWLHPGHKLRVGETLREIGILVLVFVPIDEFFNAHKEHVHSAIEAAPASDFFTVVYLILGSIVCIALGIKIEYDAEKDEASRKDAALAKHLF